jgi:peroxiredoxin Q/BCP
MRPALGVISAVLIAGAACQPAASARLTPGQPAPDFSAVAHDGQTITLSKLRGTPVVLYFYPKDDTTGCTKEACEFRDRWGDLKKAGVLVFGVSTQDNTSHSAFAQKYALPFPLIPDEKGALAAKYLVPVVNGHAQRVTYLIGKDGRIEHVWPKVDPGGHAQDILNHLNAR